MTPPGGTHLIESERIDVTASADEGDYNLLERLGELNKARLVPLIERVLEDYDRPGAVTRIDRVALDLGRFGRGELHLVEARLEEALREALDGLVDRAAADGAAQGDRPVAILAAARARIEALEHFLLRGTWPYGSSAAVGAAPADLFAALLAEAPGALAAMLRRHAGSRVLVERLVRQMPRTLLERLLRVLDPESAAWILSYMDESRAAHAAQPVVEQGEAEFDRTLWTVVIRDALNRAGLRANRRSFVERLVAGLAESAGVAAEALVEALQAALASVAAAGRGEGSLLSILAEIGGEAVGGGAQRAGGAEARQEEGPRDFPALIRWLEARGAAGATERKALRRLLLAEEAGGGEGRAVPPAELRWLLQRLARRDGASLVRRLDGVLSARELFELMLPPEALAATAAALPEGASLADCGALIQFAAALPGPRSGPARRKAEAALARLLGIASDEARQALLVLETQLFKGTAAPGYEQAVNGEGGGALARLVDLLEGRGGETGGAPLRPINPWQAYGDFPEEAGAAVEGAAGSWTRAVQDLAGEGGDLPLLCAALEAAAAADTLELQRLLRGLAAADAGRLVERLGGTKALPVLLPLIVRPPRAGFVAAVAAAAGPSADEAALLLGAAAQVPVGGSTLRLVHALVAPLAQSRRTSEARIAASLAKRLAGGDGGADAQQTLRRLAAGRGRYPPEREALRCDAVDRLRDYLHAWPRPAAGEAGPDLRDPARLVRALAGTSGVMLRERLGGAALPRERARAALARLPEAVLLRLALLLAPADSAGRTAVRSRLRAGLEPEALAGLVAALLVVGRLEEADAEAPPGTPAEASPAEAAPVEKAWALVAEAVRRGRPLSSPRLREALALLLRERPFEAALMIPRGGAAGGGGGAVFADPELMALLFAALPPSERSLAGALAAVLAEPGSPRPLPADRLGAALASAAGALLGSAGGEGRLAAAWLRTLFAAASLSERQGLRTRLARRWPDDPANAAIRAALGLDRLDGSRGAQGSAARLCALVAQKPDGWRERLRAALRDPSTRRRLLEELPERELAEIAGSLEGDERRRLLAEAKAAAAGGGSAEASPEPRAGSPLWVLALLRERPRGWERRLRRALMGSDLLPRVAALLPERDLAALATALAPREAASLIRAAEIAADALSSAGGSLARGAMWALVLSAALEGGNAGTLAARLLSPEPLAGLRPPRGRDPAAAVEAALLKRARQRGHAPLAAALEERAAERQRRAPKPRRAEPPKERKLWDKEPAEPGERFFIANAGLVLLAPFLPQFFARLGLLAPDGKGWASDHALERAVHLLQYLAAEQLGAPEPVLALNKLLCGQPLAAPALAAIEATPEELEVCASLLAAAVASWPPMQGSSVAALRETFLQRDGAIERTEGGWRVVVERKVLDVLLDSLPWSYSMILHPWMKETITVEW